MKRAAIVIGTLLWCFAVFALVQRLTFPSDDLIERARYEVERQSGGSLVLDVGSVSPWWVGLKAYDVSLAKVGPDGKRGDDLLDVDLARVRIGTLSLLRRQPRISGAVQLGDGWLDFSAEVAQLDGNNWAPTAIDIDSNGYPLSALPPIQGYAVSGRGAVDLGVHLDAPEGMRKAEGEATLFGSDLVVEDISGLGPVLTAMHIDLLPLLIEELDIAFSVVQGKAKIDKGKILTSIGEIELSGHIQLKDRLSRTSLHLKAEIDFTEDAEPIARFVSSAKWDDGKYHFKATGPVSRPDIGADAERGTTTRRPARTRAMPEATDPGEGGPEAAAEARERRRRELAAERAERVKDRIRTGDVGSTPRVVGVGVPVDDPKISPDRIRVDRDKLMGTAGELGPEDEPLDEEILDEEILDEEPPAIPYDEGDPEILPLDEEGF